MRAFRHDAALVRAGRLSPALAFLACCLAGNSGASDDKLPAPWTRQPTKPLPAFPGAEGFGSTTPGGRGGRVIEVTNLHPDGPGSLRAACGAKGPRIVVFRVGGVIDLPHSIGIAQPYITIAGQTAPGGGITLRNSGLVVANTHDVVIRYLRVRQGDGPGTDGDRDCLSIYRSHRVVVDHCSFSWGIDETASTWFPNREITFQWCIISEGLDFPGSARASGRGRPVKANSSKGLLIGDGDKDISVHHNLFASNRHRSPLLKGGTRTDVVNNVIYNAGMEWSMLSDFEGTAGRITANFVGNYYKAGPSTHPYARQIREIRVATPAEVYVRGNLGPSRPDETRSEWDIVGIPDKMVFHGKGPPRAVPENEARVTRLDKPFPAPPISTHSAREAFKLVVEKAGAGRVRDAVDLRIMREVKSGQDFAGTRGKIIVSQKEVGGWPAIAPGMPPADADHDGMPDVWERAHGLDPANPHDGKVLAPSGYTWVEEYLNSLTMPEEPGKRGTRRTRRRARPTVRRVGAHDRARATSARAARLVKTVDGDDWWLPPHVKLTPYSGYISWQLAWSKRKAADQFYQDGQVHFAIYASFTWQEINPAEDVYDWKRVDKRIQQFTATPGIGFVFWINGYRKDAVPPWVVEKTGIKFLANGTVAAWESGCEYQKYFGRMIRALGKRYRNHPKLIGVDMRGFGRDWGEWCWRGGLPMLKEAEERTGLTPETLRVWAFQFVDDFVEAFQGQEKKLVWINGKDNFIWQGQRKHDYGPVSRAIWRYAYQKGCGGRDGNIEVWNDFLNEGHGIRHTDEGYLEVIEDSAPIRSGALWYTENEFYLTPKQLFGPPEFDALRWFVSNMRALQMRRNWLWPSPRAVDELLPEFNRWMELSFGKSARTSADAWCWLREGYLRSWTNYKPVKNFERWLLQRDVGPDGRTAPTARVDISQLNQGASGKGYEFHARRTQRHRGSPHIYFRTDPEFMRGGPHAVRLKVTYLDGPVSRWRIDYTGGGGPTHAPVVETAGTGRWKTVTFEVPEMFLRGAFHDSMDFRIAAVGPEDVTIKLVRLIKSVLGPGKTGTAQDDTQAKALGARARRKGSERAAATESGKVEPALALAREKVRSAAARAFEIFHDRIVTGAQSGRREQVFIELAGTIQRTRIISADATGLLVSFQGAELHMPWKTISPRRFAGIAAKYSGEAPDERLCLAALYAAAGVRTKARDILDELGDLENHLKPLAQSIERLVKPRP